MSFRQDSGQLLVARFLVFPQASGGLRTEQHHQPTPVFTKAQTNRMDIGANNERLTQASSSLPGFSYSPRQAVVSAPSKTTNQLR